MLESLFSVIVYSNKYWFPIVKNPEASTPLVNLTLPSKPPTAAFVKFNILLAMLTSVSLEVKPIENDTVFITPFIALNIFELFSS